ncbi:MAG: DUF4252 domain-containing protein [Bacteroidales bacterium]|jgi:hypothetical protein
MKKTLFTVLLLIGNLTLSFAQDQLKDIVLQFSSMPKAEHIHVGGLMMRIAQVCADDQESEFISGIRSVSILSLEHCDQNIKEAFGKQIEKIRDNDLELLAEVTEESENVRILAQISDDIIERFVVIITGDDASLIQINGKIDLVHMEELIAQNTNNTIN